VIEQAKTKLGQLEGESLVQPVLNTAAPSVAQAPAIEPITEKAVSKVAEEPQFPMQSDMFASQPSVVEQELAELSLDDITPRQAQELLYKLQSML